MHKKLSAAQVFQDQIQFAPSLEGIDQLNDEWMLKEAICLLKRTNSIELVETHFNRL